MVEVDGQTLNTFKKDTDWIDENLNELRKEYPDKFVAVRNGKVVVFDRDLNTVLERLREKGIDPAFTPVEFISKEPAKYKKGVNKNGQV